MRWIDRTLNSIRNLKENYETIVVDNNSQDDTLKFIENNFPEIILLKENENHGFGKANNIGIKKALDEGADYVFLLNQDAYVEPDTIEKLNNVLNMNQTIGVASPIHLNGEGNSLDKLFSFYVAPKLVNTPCLFMSDLYLNTNKPYYEINFVNAAAWLIRGKCIEKIGLFDSLFYHYGEDVNYCQRLKYHQLTLAIVPESKIYHDRGDRVIKKDVSQKFKFRSLLIELANINLSDDDFNERISYLKKHYLFQSLFHFFRLRKSRGIQSYNTYRFLKIKKDEIIQSRMKNK
jgi:GT2 family glycosyltransferase